MIASESYRPIPFNQPLDKAVLDINHKNRSNPLAWRGQFSPQFVQAMLENYTHQQDVILDPFAGSGTVLIEAAYLGHPAYGFEVNPAATTLAKLYTLTRYTQKKRRSLLLQTQKIISEVIPLGLPLFSTSIKNQSNQAIIPPLISRLSQLEEATIKILIEALVVKLDLSDDNIPPDKFWSKWYELDSLVSSLPQSKNPISIELDDARYLPLPDNMIDFVLTSPPYINVFNYHHNYRTSVEMLGWKPLVSAKSEIGANRKFRQNRFLTVVQYCMDMSLSLAELTRVCRDSGRIVFVIGRESNVHKTPFFNGVILRRLAEEIIQMQTTLQQERKFKNKFGNLIKEDILHFLLSGDKLGEQSAIVEQAKNIGEKILLSVRDKVPRDRRKYLDDALSRASEIEPSPKFIASQAKE